MDKERDEVYERIPWETLESKGGDRQWIVYAVAGAVTLGALAYSFTKNQPTAPPATVAAVASTVAGSSATQPPVTEPSIASPVVVAEADLYAIDPERIIDQVVAHAEWFAVEYISYDGSERSREALTALLPDDVPAPEAPEGTQVYVDWARATQITELGPLNYQVDVLIRSLSSNGDPSFTRQAARLLTVDIALTDDGAPRVSSAPVLRDTETVEPANVSLTELPEQVAAGIDGSEGEVLGGRQNEDGSWDVVVMAPGPDGVTRPVTLRP